MRRDSEIKPEQNPTRGTLRGRKLARNSVIAKSAAREAYKRR